MSVRKARRAGALLATVLLLTGGLIAPTAAAAAADDAATAGRGDVLGPRGSVRDDAGVRAAANGPIEVRDLRFSCPSGRVPAAPFRDVPRGSALSRTVDCLLWYGVTQGTSATAYSPNSPVTRQQMAVFLYRLLDDLIVLPDAPARSIFADVPDTRSEIGAAINVLASDELEELLGIRIITGRTATTYDPAGRVTRAQMGSFVARTLEGVANYYGAGIEQGHCGDPARPDVGCFPDEAQIPPPHRGNVASLYRIGIVQGRSGGAYAPAADVTRGQMAAFLTRLLDVFVEGEITVPPDRFVDLHVDRERCAPSGTQTGTRQAPFCEIQRAVGAAHDLPGYAVSVLVQPFEGLYEGATLSSQDAFAVDVIGDPDGTGADLSGGTAPEAGEAFVAIGGTVRIDGGTRDANALVNVVGLAAVDVRTNGAAYVLGNVLVGDTGLRIQQSGGTLALFNWFADADVAVDVVETSWGQTTVSGNLFDALRSNDVYVRAPAGTPTTDPVLRSWEQANLFRIERNGQPEPADTRIETRGGRAVIVPG